eukprot:TRINITY_DN24390_c0_g1_i1.p1 TRINITY_DN24390_c0_g1~~TRINITY_DN24390_c0_g1_i1.p1  ORF type:complete len:436 (+),score=61.19 TRINITY_DN24390_c0_g1_i1:186-1493(+)
MSLQWRWLMVQGLAMLCSGCAAAEVKPSDVHWQTPGVSLDFEQLSDLAQTSDSEYKLDMSVLHPGTMLGAAFHVATHGGAAFSLLESAPDPFQMTEVNISLPCLMGFISPCGNVTVGDTPVKLQTPFGSVEIPGTSELRRASIHQTLTDIWEGELEKEDYALTLEETDELKKEKLDPKSKHFIAPANIYRLIALSHPPVLTWSDYLKLSAQGLVCGFMQCYVPYKILHVIVIDHGWHPIGIKAFFWYVVNAGHAAAMAAAVGGLCHVFAGKCTTNILKNAVANHYILTHMVAPDKSVADVEDPSRIKWRAVHVSFWCVLCTLMSCWVSLSLFIIMYVKVATYTGDFHRVALIAVSLYFVFDLDQKIIESSPSYLPRYDAKVARLTEKIGTDFRWMKSLAHGFQVLADSAAPFAFLMLVLVAWKNSAGEVIGGDPF